MQLKQFKSKNNFFEMMRFDLVIDDTLTVHLLEANMSPNLSSAHFLQNTLLYEQVIYNLLNLVGVGSTLHRESLRKRYVKHAGCILFLLVSVLDGKINFGSFPLVMVHNCLAHVIAVACYIFS